MSETAQREMEYVSIEDLEYAAVRDIRPNVVSDIKDRIGESGYNPARPMRVVRENGHFIVADGNHRLKSLHELDHGEKVPCVIESEDADVHALAVASNRDEDTYAEMDLFDWLDVVDELRDDHTQAEVGEKIGWSRSKVSQYTTLLRNVATQILDLAREHQKGRVASDATNVATSDFTEGWFRESGIYSIIISLNGTTNTGERREHPRRRRPCFCTNESRLSGSHAPDLSAIPRGSAVGRSRRAR